MPDSPPESRIDRIWAMSREDLREALLLAEVYGADLSGQFNRLRAGIAEHLAGRITAQALAVLAGLKIEGL